MRTALFLGVVFIMSTRPGLVGSLTALMIAAVAGVAAAAPVRGAGRRQARMAGSPR